MTALAAKTFSKFGPEIVIVLYKPFIGKTFSKFGLEIVIVMYKPFIGYFFMRGEHQYYLF